MNSPKDNRTQQDLQRLLAEAETKLRELLFSLAANQLKNVRDVRKMRKEIARLKTALHAKTYDTTNEQPNR